MEQTNSSQSGGGRGIMVERGERISQRTCMNDPWTWTTLWGLTVGVEGGLGRGGQRGQHWDNCNRVTIKNNKNSLLGWSEQFPWVGQECPLLGDSSSFLSGHGSSVLCTECLGCSLINLCSAQWRGTTFILCALGIVWLLPSSFVFYQLCRV